MSSQPTLVTENLVKHFRAGGNATVHAVNGVSFSISPGETLGMVGESGSGKSTIGRTVLRLLSPTAGRILFQGRDISTLPERQCRSLRAEMQMVFQDPWSALNPRLRARALIEEPLLLHSGLGRAERRDKVEALAARVRLGSALLERFPSELSGGQLQRVCIARAIATEPKLIVLDEPTSSLDLSVRAGILELLHELKQETGAAMLFISHDLGTLRLISDRIVVLYLGSVVESGPTRAIFERPEHPYTQALMSAHLPADPTVALSRHVLKGEIPSPINLPPGCGFASRCPLAIERCRAAMPPLAPVPGDNHHAACIRIAEGANRIPA
ncbi:MAG: ABC transporter ATP-binding protein [Alphaproteobacteria bacterium]|nr:ABC transporter ATP-binding protein [Alphaproteobacteria bacterium]